MKTNKKQRTFLNIMRILMFADILLALIFKHPIYLIGAFILCIIFTIGVFRYERKISDEFDENFEL